MRKSLDFGQFRTKALDSLVKDQTDPKSPSSETNTHRTPLFKNFLKKNTMHSPTHSTTHKTPLNNHQLPNITPKPQDPALTSHIRTSSEQSQSIPYSFQRPSILSPTTSSLKKLVQLSGPNKKYNRDKQTGPGPGAYHKELKIGGASYAIGRGQRIIERKAGPVGPGKYDLPTLSTGIQYSMTPRRQLKNKIPDLPGPGAYSPSNLEPGIKFSISKADRNKKRNIDSPGPGSYTISRPSSSRSALTVKSHRPPLSLVVDTPGPGSYNIELKIGGPELSLRQKYAVKSQSIEPGPGSYSPVMSMTSPCWRFGSCKKRLEFNDFTVPGPGWYNTRRSC